MATSGTVTFNLDIEELIEEAYEQTGLDMKTAYNLRSARRSLDLLFKEWQNKQVNLWKMELLTTDCISGTATYTLATTLQDVLDVSWRNSSGNDTPLERIGMSKYLDIVDKDAAGPPINYVVERGISTITLRLWPVPDSSTYDLVYWGIKKIEDTGAYSNQLDLPKRFMPALIAGLAHKIGGKNPARMAMENGRVIQVGGVSDQKLAQLANDYKVAWDEAQLEDREKSSFFIHPGR